MHLGSPGGAGLEGGWVVARQRADQPLFGERGAEKGKAWPSATATRIGHDLLKLPRRVTSGSVAGAGDYFSVPNRHLGGLAMRRAHAHRSGRHRSRCDRGRAARRTCTTAAITAGTDEAVHAELSSQLASSSRDDVLGSACPSFGPRGPVGRQAPPDRCGRPRLPSDPRSLFQRAHDDVHRVDGVAVVAEELAGPRKRSSQGAVRSCGHPRQCPTPSFDHPALRSSP
jgi:hypothetical protein